MAGNASRKQEKRDFGSFHASNVQDLLSLPEDEYTEPVTPFQLPTFDKYRYEEFRFGDTARKRHFFIETRHFLNHGAFGAVLKEAMDVAQAWQRYIEHQPLRFFDRELLPHLVHITRCLAKFVGCSPQDLILLPNVTTGVNCVMRSQKLKQEDVVFHLSTEYGAVKKIIQQVCLEDGATAQEAFLPLPLASKQQILDLVARELKPGTKLAVFDHIPSNSPFIMPIESLIELCHNRGVPVLVDGAHALGMLDLQLDTLGADYYVCNAHKWFCAPKGSALMYVSRSHQEHTQALVISHGFGSGFNSQFIWSGLRDYSSFLSLPTVIQFWQRVGCEKIRKYICSMALKAAKLLQTHWNSALLCPEYMCGSMIDVQLPKDLYKDCSALTYTHAEKVQNILYAKYGIEVPIKCIQGNLYTRISFHIYNEIEAYEYLAKCMSDMVICEDLYDKP